MTSAKRLQFSELISAPASHVYEQMIGPDSYKDWTTPFCEGSYYEGSWAEGQRIRFLSPGGEGMVSEIAANRPNEFISIRHLGMFAKGVDDTDSESVRAWAPAYENYTFEAVPEGTHLVVDMDVAEEWEDFMNEAWPTALARLKVLCEERGTA